MVKKAMKQLKSQDIKIVMTGFNSKVGNERTGNIIGSIGIGEKNEKGDRLIKFARNLT